MTGIIGRMLQYILEATSGANLEANLDLGTRSIQDLIFTLLPISEKIINENKEIHICFIDLDIEFDKIRREDIWQPLCRRRIDGERLW